MTLPGWLPRRLWMLAHECDDRAMYAGWGKFSGTHSAAADALRQAAQRIKELERERREAAIEIERLRDALRVADDLLKTAQTTEK